MFVLYANCNFIPGKYDAWIAAYRELAKYVYADEPTTLTYYFGTPENYGVENRSKTTHMLAYEAYTKREALYETHFKSSAMGSFLPKIPPLMTTGLDLAHYEDVAGFLDKKGDGTECGIIWDTRLTIQPGKMDAVLEELKKLAKWVETDEPDAYTYLVHRGLDEDNANELRILERYTSREALDAHQSSKQVLDFFRTTKDNIARLENRGYLPNSEGWLHR